MTEIWKVTGTEEELNRARWTTDAWETGVDFLDGAGILEIVMAARPKVVGEPCAYLMPSAADIDDYLARKGRSPTLGNPCRLI
jgi:hypothetical protein